MRLYSKPFLCLIICSGLTAESGAALGLARESYGVWDRSGGNLISEYPFTRGQEYTTAWEWVNPGSNTFDWSELDDLLQFAYDQNQQFFAKVSPVGGQGAAPDWVYSSGVPQTTDGIYVYGYYLDPDYQTYFSEMVQAMADHIRNDVPSHLQEIIGFVRVDTGATGDEQPYEEAANIPPQYQISPQEWQDYRLWVFEVYRQAFQEGPGPKIPLLFQSVENTKFPTEWSWVTNNVLEGFGVKYAGKVRGHHLTDAREVTETFKPYAVDSVFGLFSRNEMDQTWQKPFFQLNIRLNMYWCAVEQLHPGLSVWDVTRSCLDNTYIDDYAFAFEFFNKWAAELDPPTARGGFCIFHEGLDSSDTVKFPEASYGNANANNEARYLAICASNSANGAQMDDLYAATRGQVYQRASQTGFNDSGWQIVPGNYERFITQIEPDNTSKGLWRVHGTLTAASHPFDRFARRFDSASGMNTMYFDVNDHLTPNPGQLIELSVIYLDSGTGQFALQYDAVGNSRKTAFVVTKGNSNTWKTNSVVVTDWVFGNNGPNGADLMLDNVDADDDIFHSIELVKLVNVNVGIVGQGTVSARNDATVYFPVTGLHATGLRMEMTVTPEQGWSFTGWSGDLSGTNDRAILFPTNVNTQVTATFANTGSLLSADDFETGMWDGGSGWSSGWSTNGGTVVESDSDLDSIAAHLTRNGRITRALDPPQADSRLVFDWKLKSLDDPSEYAQAEVYDGAWHIVWTNTSVELMLGTEDIDLGAYGEVSQVRFTVIAGGGADHFHVDNVELSGSATAPYSAWSNQYSLVQGPEGNDDGDALNNLYEYGLGGNPTNDADLGYIPTFGKASGGGSNWFEYIHVRQTDPNSGLLYYLELCDNLVSNVWTTNGYTVVGSGPFTNGFDAVTNRIDTDMNNQQFIRLIIDELQP